MAMQDPIDTYREGYERGRADTLGSRVGELMLGNLRDDPEGHFAAGYRDGSAGQKFSPPRPSQSTSAAEPAPQISDLEKAWYALCDHSSFIDQNIVDYYVGALRAQGSHAAIVVGLSDFTGQVCPGCGAIGQFKIRFLGRLDHTSGCRWSGYMGTVRYIGYQISEVFHSGVRAGGGMKDDADRKGDASGGWVYGIVGFLFGMVFRAAAAVVLVKLHTIVVLFQPRTHFATRLVSLAAVLIAIAFGVYLLTPSRMQSSSAPFTTESVPPSAGAHLSPGTVQSSVVPSFDCGKAKTNVERLICTDVRLAALDKQMATTYKQILDGLPEAGKVALRREHLAWFKDYSRVCNGKLDDAVRAACVTDRLSTRTSQLASSFR